MTLLALEFGSPKGPSKILIGPLLDSCPDYMEDSGAKWDPAGMAQLMRGGHFGAKFPQLPNVQWQKLQLSQTEVFPALINVHRELIPSPSFIHTALGEKSKN